MTEPAAVSGFQIAAAGAAVLFNVALIVTYWPSPAVLVVMLLLAAVAVAPLLARDRPRSFARRATFGAVFYVFVAIFGLLAGGVIYAPASLLLAAAAVAPRRLAHPSAGARARQGVATLVAVALMAAAAALIWGPAPTF